MSNGGATGFRSPVPLVLAQPVGERLERGLHVGHLVVVDLGEQLGLHELPRGLGERSEHPVVRGRLLGAELRAAV
jgi:hypothetical protein